MVRNMVDVPEAVKRAWRPLRILAVAAALVLVVLMFACSPAVVLESPAAYAWHEPKTKATSMSVDIPVEQAAVRLMPYIVGDPDFLAWRRDVNRDYYAVQGADRPAEDPNNWKVESILPIAALASGDVLTWSDLRPVGAFVVILSDSEGAFASYALVRSSSRDERVWRWNAQTPINAAPWGKTMERVRTVSNGRTWESRLILSGRRITWLAVEFSDGETALFPAEMSWPSATIGGERVDSSEVYSLQDLAKPLSTE